MKNLKKLTAITAAAVMAVSMAGCSSGGSRNSSAAGDSPQTSASSGGAHLNIACYN